MINKDEITPPQNLKKLKKAAYDKVYRKTHPERAVYNRAWKKSHPETAAAYHIRISYGITVEEYDALYELQGGRCVICGRHQSKLKRALCVDHNHATGQVRGLLCIRCNSGIGHFQDNSSLVRFAADYLDNYQKGKSIQ